jgi:hypothetical protein
MSPSFIVVLLAGLVPMIVGFLWYGSLFKNRWMRESGVTQEMAEGGNMPLIFGLAYVFSVMAAFILFSVTVHQTAVYSLFVEPGTPDLSEASKVVLDGIMAEYGDRYRSFGHGALHGGIAGVFLALPVLAVNALFERKSFKYIAINAGYWIVSFMLMGGVVCQWG